MNWQTIKKVQEMTGKPERTIRHYAAKGKIRVKKNGSKWLCDLNSIQELGWLPAMLLGSLPNSQPSPDIVEVTKSSSDSTPPKTKERKPHVLESLGVFQEMLLLTRELLLRTDLPPNLNQQMSQCLHSIGLGFYEYQPLIKVQHFRVARNSLVAALLQFQIFPSEDLNKYKSQIETSLLPGLGGLIRGVERRKYARESRSQNSAKN